MDSHINALAKKLQDVNFVGSIQVEGNLIDFNSYGTSITIEVDETNKSHTFIALSDTTLTEKLNGILK